MADAQETARSPLERVLGLVTEVRAGEGMTALLLTFNIFLLFVAYYLIKPVREALILAMDSGAEYKSYMGGAIAIALLGAVPAYSEYAKRVPRNRLVVSVTLFFAVNLVLFYSASSFEAVRSSMWLGLGFYLWVGIFNMMVVAQAWAFAADIYSEEQGKRIFALIGVGASLGSVVGSKLASAAIEALGVYSMLLIAAILLTAFAGIVQLVHRREGGGQPKVAGATTIKDKDQGGSFSMVFSHRYLLLIAIFSLLFTLVNTNGEYIVGKLVSDHANALESSGSLPNGMSLQSYITQWYGEFFFYVNLVSAAVQFFLVSRIVKFAGMNRAFLLFPVVALIDASLIAIVPMLALVRIGKTVENSIDYSLNNTLRNMLWLPTTKEMKYRAKQAVDTFFVRMGDVSSAILVFLLGGTLHLGVRWFGVANVIAVGAWIAVALQILRERSRLLKEQGLDDETQDPN